MSSLPSNIDKTTVFPGLRLSVMEDGLPDIDIATPIELDVTWAEWSKANPQAADDFDRRHFLKHITALLLSLQDCTLVKPLDFEEVAPFYDLAGNVKNGRCTVANAFLIIEQDRRWMHEDTAAVVTSAVRYWNICREHHAGEQTKTN